MNRLIKKASITLQHATTLENFISIINDGCLKPFSESQSRSYSNSFDQNSIYLSKYSGIEFARDMISHSSYQTGVYMDLNVDENNLLPAYDFFEYNCGEYYDDDGNEITKDNENLTWKDTIDMGDECRYNGSIPINNIDSVTIITNNNELKNQYKNTFDKKLSLQEAENFVNNFKK